MKYPTANRLRSFKFVQAEQDKEVVLERNDNYWEQSRNSQASVRRRARHDHSRLELRKGSADIALNALTSDMVVALEMNPNLQVERAPGTIVSYLSFNMRDPVLKDFRVRRRLHVPSIASR